MYNLPTEDPFSSNNNTEDTVYFYYCDHPNSINNISVNPGANLDAHIFLIVSDSHILEQPQSSSSFYSIS